VTFPRGLADGRRARFGASPSFFWRFGLEAPPLPARPLCGQGALPPPSSATTTAGTDEPSGTEDICICAILKSGLHPFAIPQNGFSKMPVSNVNQLLQCLFLILLPILQFNQPELTKIPLGAGPLGSQMLALLAIAVQARQMTSSKNNAT
jgi:hypothetical protein